MMQIPLLSLGLGDYLELSQIPLILLPLHLAKITNSHSHP